MISSDVQKLDVGAIIELFVLDTSKLPNGSPPRYFTANVNELRQPVVWQGQTYTPFAIEASGFEWTSNGTLPRPTIRVSNKDGIVTSLVLDMQDMIGAKITRKRTLVKYLDTVNFVDGVNPDADPDSHFPDELYAIRRKSKENPTMVEFELGAPWDVMGVLLPTRQIIANVCTWRYRGPECGYVPGPMFLADDTPTNNELLDRCGKRVSSCKRRFGPNNELPYGGFPAAGLMG